MDRSFVLVRIPFPLTDKTRACVFHAKDRTKVGYASNVSSIHDDIEPCSELKGHAVKLNFSPSPSKWLDGELQHITLVK